LTHPGRLRKWRDAVLHQPVEGEVFTHVFEKVFLTPPRTHPHGQSARFTGLIIGGKDADLGTVGAAAADFTQPQAVQQARAAFGEVHGDFFAVDQREGVRCKLFGRPVGTRKLVVAEDGQTERFHLREERG